MVCFVFCPVLCGVLVLGWALAQCRPARFCAGSCCAAFVVLCRRVLLCSLPVFFFFSFFALFLAFWWCSGLFLSVLCSAVVRLAVRRALSLCVLVLVSAALCRLVLCCAVVRLLVLCCVIGFAAVLGSCLASSAAVAGCCALSLLGRGAVASCCAACGPGVVLPCAVFLGASLFVAPLVLCCFGVSAPLLSVRCPFAALAPAGVVCCCLL